MIRRTNSSQPTTQQRDISPHTRQRIEFLKTKLEREKNAFESIPYDLDVDSFFKDRFDTKAKTVYSLRSSKSLPKLYDRSIENSLGKLPWQRAQASQTLDSFPIKHDDLSMESAICYDDALKGKLLRAKEKHPDLSIPEAAIANQELTGYEISRFWPNKGKWVEGSEKYTDSNLFRAVSTGQKNIANQLLLNASGHGYTQDEAKQLIQHSSLEYRAKVKDATEYFKTNPHILEQLFKQEGKPIGSYQPHELTGAHEAMTPEQAAGNPNFALRSFLLPGEKNWDNLALALKKGARPEFRDISSALTSLQLGTGEKTLVLLLKATKVGLISSPHQFLCDLARDSSHCYYSPFLKRKTDQPREILFTKFFETSTLNERRLLMKPDSNGETPISILRSQYLHLTPMMRAFVDKFPNPLARAGTRARM